MTNPLSKTNASEAQAGLYECRTLVQDIEKAQACGINCDEHELRNTGLLKFFTDVLREYFSQAPESRET